MSQCTVKQSSEGSHSVRQACASQAHQQRLTASWEKNFNGESKLHIPPWEKWRPSGRSTIITLPPCAGSYLARAGWKIKFGGIHSRLLCTILENAFTSPHVSDRETLVTTWKIKSSVNSQPGEQCLLISRINKNNGAWSLVHYKQN